MVPFKPLQNQQKSVLCILLSPPHPSQPVNQGCIPFHVSEVSKANTKADLQYSKSHWAAVNFLGNEKNDTGHRNFPGSSPHSFPPTYPLKSHFVLSIEFPCKNESSGPTQCRPETVGTSLRLFPPHHLKITCWK